MSEVLSLEEWRARKAQGDLIPLPSGLGVYVKAFTVMDLAASGEIPQTLAPKLNQLISGDNVKKVSVGDFREFAEIIDLVCKAALVGPVGLEVAELSYGDKINLFNYLHEAYGPGKKLEPFRRQPKGDVATVQFSDGVRAEAEWLVGAGPGGLGSLQPGSSSVAGGTVD